MSRPWKVRLTCDRWYWGLVRLTATCGGFAVCGQDVGEHAVIRGDECALGGAHGDGPPGAAYAGVHDDQVDGIGWKVGHGGVQHVGGIAHVLGRDVVGDVHQCDVGGDAQDHPEIGE